MLILLFCIFLLMEFNSALQADEESEKVAEASAEAEVLAATLDRRTKELQRFEEIRPQLADLDKILEELDRLAVPPTRKACSSKRSFGSSTSTRKTARFRSLTTRNRRSRSPKLQTQKPPSP